jgi:hypothetical protein
MDVPVSAPAPFWLAVFAGSMSALLFLLPRLAAQAPFLAVPLSVLGLLSALPLLAARISGRLPHAGLACVIAMVLLTLADSSEAAMGFGVLFGLWALVAGEVLARRRSVIIGCAAGLLVLATEGLIAFFAEGTAPIEATLRSPQVQTAFDQWARQSQLDGQEAQTTIERVRSGVVALYPSLCVISAATIVAMNAIALGGLVGLRGDDRFPKGELLTLRWPLTLVVAFVASGALLLVPELATIAWNGLVATLFLFLLQGLSVFCFGLTRLFSSGLVRSLLVVAALLGPWAVLLSLLGLFDQWFDFRSRLANRPAPAPPSN